MFNRYIYVVSVFDGFELDDFYRPDCVYKCVGVKGLGFYMRWEDAVRCVREMERMKEYVCVEEVREGLYPCWGEKW